MPDKIFKSIKSFLLLPVFFLALGLAAENNPENQLKNFNWTCATTPFSSSLVAVQQGNKMVLRVFHHNGLQSVPIHRGVITPNDLTILAQRAELLQQLGSQFELEFAIDQCEVFGEWRINCANTNPAIIGNLNVRRVYLDTSVSQTTALDLQFESRLFRVGFLIGNQVYDMPFEYWGDNCSFNSN